MNAFRFLTCIYSPFHLVILTCLISFQVSADAWLDDDEGAIWQRSPGVYAEGGSWYVIFHAAAMDQNVRLQADFIEGSLPLTRTPDGKFWWFKGSVSDFARAPQHGDEYHFLLERGGETLRFQDPAARWLTGTDLAVDSSKIFLSDNFSWTDDTWVRPTADQLNIYQLHPLRFTDRNNAGSPLLEVKAELDRSGDNDYINNLGVTALELLPVSEFSGELSWGYNPNYFYAVESAYGGPNDLKALVNEAHQQGIAVILDLEFNHLATGSDNILYALDKDTYADGETIWGPLYNFNNDVASHFLIQNVLYLAREFHIDGFRFDHTNTIHNPDSFAVTTKGDGGGWQFLRELYGAVKQQDENIWFTAEELPDWWGITAEDVGSMVAGSRHGPMDSQWSDEFHDKFKAVLTGGHLDLLRDVFGHFGGGWEEATVYTESHDEVGNTDDRIARRGRDGKGWEMSQISAAGTLLARGVPMIFMGQEAAEMTQFHIDWWDDRLALDDYEHDAGRQKIVQWFARLNTIRRENMAALSKGDSVLTSVHDDNGVAAFSRADGKYIVALNFKGRTWTNYDVGVYGRYIELANTSWPVFNIGGVDFASRGGEQAFDIASLRIPAYGAVVLKRVDSTGNGVSVHFACKDGFTSFGQNVYVVGNIPQLGGWDTNKAVKLNAINYPVWTKTIDHLPANTHVSWKCIKRDVGDVVWQPGSDNVVELPADGGVNSVAAF